MEFSITIRNDSDLINIYPILLEINSYQNSNLKLSKYINTRPHINNSSYIINKISGCFI